MVIATVRDGFYDLFLFLHITAAVVGFGSVLLNGLYGAQAKQRPGPGGLAITEANYWVSVTVSEKAIYLVPLFGFALIGLSDGAWSFSDSWITASLVVYVIGLTNARLVLVPTQKHMIDMMREGPPDPVKMDTDATRLARFGAVS